MNIHILQHVSFEGPEMILDWAEKHGHKSSYTRFFRGEPLPEMSAFDILIVMGGPMSVADEKKIPWLAGEKEFLAEAILNRKKILGICLGAQLVAEALGVKVYAGRKKEIGWFPIEFTREIRGTSLGEILPGKFEAFHWHGETFDIPEGAVRLAQSEAFPNQGFLFGENILALQFHLEITTSLVRGLIGHGANEIRETPSIQTPKEMLASPEKFSRANLLMFKILDRFLGS